MPWHAEQDVTLSSGHISPPSQNASGNSTILIALVMAFAVAGGAILTTLGTIGFDGLIDNTGLSRTTLSARQYEQASTLAALDRTITAVNTEVAALRARLDKASGPDMIPGDRLAKFSGELDIVKRGIRHLAADLGNIDRRVEAIAAGAPGGDPAAAERLAKMDADLTALKKTVAEVATDVEYVGQRVETVAVRAVTASATLRSSIDANDERLAAVTKRLDKIESTMAGDLTSSIPPQQRTGTAAQAPVRKRIMSGTAGWSIHEASEGRAVIAGRSGTFEVEPGSIVPGLGRVDDIKQQRGRWVVTTARGSIVAHRATFPDLPFGITER
jgi:uncharacterized coiled-coil protein SlyX